MFLASRWSQSEWESHGHEKKLNCCRRPEEKSAYEREWIKIYDKKKNDASETMQNWLLWLLYWLKVLHGGTTPAATARSAIAGKLRMKKQNTENIIKKWHSTHQCRALSLQCNTIQVEATCTCYFQCTVYRTYIRTGWLFAFNRCFENNIKYMTRGKKRHSHSHSCTLSRRVDCVCVCDVCKQQQPDYVQPHQTRERESIAFGYNSKKKKL